MQPHREKRWLACLLVLAVLWIGLLLGVSFLATPAKFLAPSLSLPVALDVGRHTFAVFNRVEWLLVIAVVLTVFLIQSFSVVAAAALIGSLLIVETIWLLPVLDQRVGAIIAGQSPEPSSHHTLYIVVELAKLILLSGLAFSVTERILRR